MKRFGWVRNRLNMGFSEDSALHPYVCLVYPGTVSGTRLTEGKVNREWKQDPCLKKLLDPTRIRHIVFILEPL